MLKENDFVEIDYIARIKGDGIFDLTMEDVARKNNIYSKDYKYRPAVICLGKKDIIKGLDNQLIGKEIGECIITINPEDGFGKKDPKLIKLVPTKEFTKQNIRPMPGMQLNIEGFMGRILSVTGGRTLVDFNNPLAGKELEYDVKIKRRVTDKKEQLQGFLDISFKDYKLEFDNDEAVIEIKNISSEVKKDLEKEILGRIELKKVTLK